jgi:hypothetical protein
MLRLCFVTGLSLLASSAAAFDAEDLARLNATGSCRGCDLSGADLHGRERKGADLPICRKRNWTPPILVARGFAAPISRGRPGPSCISPAPISAVPVWWRSTLATTKISLAPPSEVPTSATRNYAQRLGAELI